MDKDSSVPKTAAGLRRRMQAAKSSSANSSRPSSQPGQMMKIYTDDSPGITIDPVVVLVGALTFIASVFILHLGNF